MYIYIYIDFDFYTYLFTDGQTPTNPENTYTVLETSHQKATSQFRINSIKMRSKWRKSPKRARKAVPASATSKQDASTTKPASVAGAMKVSTETANPASKMTSR